jgi:hypothetical protein
METRERSRVFFSADFLMSEKSTGVITIGSRLKRLAVGGRIGGAVFLRRSSGTRGNWPSNKTKGKLFIFFHFQRQHVTHIDTDSQHL